MTTYTNLDLTIQDHIAIVTLNNPPANTWTADSLNSLMQLIDELNHNKNIQALVIHGSGSKFFCAGADLNTFADGDVAMASKMAIGFGEAFEQLSKFRGVSIACINGYAMGGGLECALACDIRIAEEQSVMALPELAVGLLPCAGGTQNLPWLVGEGWAKRMILCGERVDAKKALEIGLVEEVVATGASLEAGIALAQKVAKQSPDAIAFSKDLIQSARMQPPSYNLIKEREYFIKLFSGDNQKEGVNAFLQKRPAVWK